MKLLKNTAHYRKTKKGVVTNLYNKMKVRNVVDFSLSDLHEFSNCAKFNRLYNEWIKSDYNKQLKPSIDRINNKFGYTKTNIHWLTWAENRYKQTMERRCRKGKVAQILNDKIIKIFNSQREAAIKTGLSQSNLSQAINGKRNYCGGYRWAFIDDKEIIGNIYQNPELL